MRVHPVDGLADVGRLLGPLRRFLGTAGVACAPERLEEWAETLGRLGCTRVCAVGRMPDPAPGWHHDGRGSLAALVRWVDVEAASEEDWEAYEPDRVAPRSAWPAPVAPLPAGSPAPAPTPS